MLNVATMIGPTARALLVLLPLCLACAAPAETDGAEESTSAIRGAVRPGATLTTTSRLNLRTAPGRDAEIVTTMAAGTKVVAIAPQPTNGFYEVSYRGDRGWAYGAFLEGTAQRPSSPDDADDETSGRTFRNVTMLWQGDWSFLVGCDSYSRSRGRVVFYCDDAPSRDFVDEGAWIAIPRSVFTRSLCGTTARVCKGSSCIDARVVEKSVTDGKWEGSTAVLAALGVETGFRGCSSSFGSARDVTVTLR